jgi:hypothetical protein
VKTRFQTLPFECSVYSYATETLMVKRAGSNAEPTPVIHHRAVNAAPERAAEVGPGSPPARGAR